MRRGIPGIPLWHPRLAAAKNRTSVAILGFQNLSGSTQGGLLGDVLTDSLWSQLDVEEIRFIPPARVDEMRRDLGLAEVKQEFGKEELKRIGQYLGSDVIVTGSYRSGAGKGRGEYRLERETVASERWRKSGSSATEWPGSQCQCAGRTRRETNPHKIGNCLEHAGRSAPRQLVLCESGCTAELCGSARKITDL